MLTATRSGEQPRGFPTTRTALSTSRLLDFFSRKELVAQVGHSPSNWPLVVVEELVNNALDACEEAGTAPVISVVVDKVGITVADNGSGLPPECVEGICDSSVRVSSREAYVAPDRGAQGNALKTLVAMPFVLTGEMGRVTFVARGVRHEITVSAYRISQKPVVSAGREDAAPTPGTSITIVWPNDSVCSIADSEEAESYSSSPSDDHSACSILLAAESRFLQVVDDFTALNPHATINLRWFGEHAARQATALDWRKGRPDNPTSVHWYGPEQFGRLIAGYIAHDRDRGQNRTVREFVSEFEGLTSTRKQKAVLDETGLARSPLSTLANCRDLDRKKVDAHQAAMTGSTKPVKPHRLGVIGKEHVWNRFVGLGANSESFKYAKKVGEADGVPWVLEVAFAWAPRAESRWLITGVNWSPAIVNPFRELTEWGLSLDELLADQRAGAGSPCIVLVHLTCPRVEYTDRGKSATVVDDALGEVIEYAVTGVTKMWCRKCKAEEREARTPRAYYSTTQVTLKDAAAEVMEDAYLKASGGGTLPANARQIMYAARPAILEITSADSLDSQYFTQTLLPDYINYNREATADWQVAYDARGTFKEPHGLSTDLRLGTLEVDDYVQQVAGHAPGPLQAELADDGRAYPTCGPANRFQAVLFIEKEGFWPLLQSSGIARRFDLAMLSTKGESNVASRSLIDDLCGAHDIPLLVLHDFDVAGINIQAVLGRDNRRYQWQHDIDVVDLGVRLDDVLQQGLQTEGVSVRSGDRTQLRRNGASAEQLEFWCGGQRVELNAFASDQFIDWLEGKLTTLGITKVILVDDVLEDAFKRSLQECYVERHLRPLLEAAGEFADRQQVTDDLADLVSARLASSRQTPWDAAVADLAASLAGDTEERPT